VQSQTLGSIAGEVRDPASSIVVGATVTVTNTDTNATRNAVTNDSGLYSFPGLVPGNYTIRVQMAGFRTSARSLVLQVQQNAQIDLTLEVGQVTETVEVKAETTMLNTTDATVGTVIEQKRIAELPLNGRNYLQLVSLSPNVSFGFATANEAGGRQGGDRVNQNMSIGGARATWNNYTLDGVLNTDPNFNTYVVLPSVDMLQEFKVQSGVYPAEFGRAASQINVSTRSGSNQYHGGVYEFLRNSAMDARPYDFTLADHARTKNPFQWNQYGFTLGGPVQIPKLFNGRDKLFFMTNFEQFRQIQRVNAVYSVPSLAMRRGDFSELNGPIQLYDPLGRSVGANGQVIATPFAGNIIPPARFSPQAVRLLEFYPEPNAPSESISPQLPQRNFRRINRQTSNKDQFHTRIDWNESSQSTWFGRVSWADDAQLNPGMYLNGNKSISHAWQYMVSNTRTLSPTAVNEFRFGVNRLYSLVAGELAYTRDVLSELQIPNAPNPVESAWGIPAIGETGLSGAGGGGDPYETKNRAYQVVNNVTLIRGKHSMRFGAEVRFDRYGQFGNQFLNPEFQFNGTMSQDPVRRAGGTGFADFLLGYPSAVRYALEPVDLKLNGKAQYYFFDETWRARPNLTINIGLRYEYSPPYSDTQDTLANIYLPALLPGVRNVADQSLHPVMVRAGQGDFYEGLSFRYRPEVQVARDGRLGSRLQKADKNDFAPRLGIAWNPSPKWSVRTGAGIFYSAEVANTRFDLGRTLGGRIEPRQASDLPTLTLENFLGAPGGVFTLPASPWTWALQHDARNTYSFQYLLNVQHEFSSSTVVEVGYLGSVSRHLWGLYDSNEAFPSADGTSAASRAPFPEFGIIQTIHSNGRGNYNAGSVKLTRRFDAGLTALVSYTWSRSFDMVSAWRGQGDSRSANTTTCYLKCEYAPSSYDTPHRTTASVLYELPFGRGRSIGSGMHPIANALAGGWQISSIVTLQSGRRANFSGGRNSLAYQDGQRPHATGLPLQLPESERTLDRWFNLGAVAVPPQGVIGNMGRNTLVGPSQQSWDFSAHKRFNIIENHSLTFRFEAFNAANHPVFSRPGTNIGNNPTLYPTAFGQIRGTDTSMRQIQLGLKYAF
ncbi:MAG TPA: carboxypeptidase-like regulatory domain-containing protein, partial [Bryobacteraceae bacterium]|nr:carboxypeptidase-like regulatory domain-containing protein [Bryobacteraceae bacterium]